MMFVTLKALIGHTDERDEVTKAELDEHLYKTEIKPYIVLDKDGVQSVVTGLSSISLINRYCTNLNTSKFVNLAPTWKLHKMPNGSADMCYKVIYKNKRKCKLTLAPGPSNLIEILLLIVVQVSLKLPPISPLKETCEGEVMPSIALAKRSAALATCIKLHKMQELSDHLLPLQPSAILGSVEHLFPHWQEEPKENAGLIGTAAHKRVYQIEVSTFNHYHFCSQITAD